MAGVQMPATTSTGVVGQAAYPGVRFVQNSALEDMQRRAEEQRQRSPTVLGLSAHLAKLWEEAKTAKNHVQERLVRNLRQRNGHYDPKVQAEIAAIGGSDVYLPLTASKCRAAVAQLSSIVLPINDRAWDLLPTPEPDMPPDVEQALVRKLAEEIQGLPEAQVTPDFMRLLEERYAEFDERARELLKVEALEARDAMRSLIDDQLTEGGWHAAMSSFIEDLVTFPTAFMCGPVVRRRPTYKYDANRGLVMTYELRPEFERVSPFDIYPAPYARSLQDGYFWHRDRLAIADLEAMKGVDGYSTPAINAVISEYGAGGLREWLSHDQERAIEEGRPHDYLQRNGTIEVLKFYGPAHGALLREWGLQVADPSKAYEIQAIKIGRYIIMARMVEHLVARRPYWSTSYEKVPGSIWGKGLCDLLEASQRMINAAARAMGNNMGFASGPQVVINDISRLPPGYDYNNLRPWQTWPMKGPKAGPGTERPPVEFYQPASNAGELMGVIQFFVTQADEHSSLPPYAYGSDQRSRGAGETASGQSMLMAQASKGLQRVVKNIDDDVTSGNVGELYHYNLRYSDNPAVKGDLKAVARGASAIMAREVRTQRLLEGLQITANPIDISILGIEGRAKMLRGFLRDTMDDPAEDILPDDKPIEPMPMPGQEPPPEAEGPSPADMAKIEFERERVRNDADKSRRELEFKERVEMRRLEENVETARLREQAALQKELNAARQIDLQRERLDFDRAQADREAQAAERDRQQAERDRETNSRQEALATDIDTVRQATEKAAADYAGRFDQIMTAIAQLGEQVDAKVGAVQKALDDKIAADQKMRSAVLGEIERRGGAQAKAVARKVAG